jgi:hypothetical protein
MIESIKDLKHNRTSYESLKPLTPHHHGHHTSHSHSHSHPSHIDSSPVFSDSLATTKTNVLSNAGAIYGPTRSLDILTYASTHSRKITAAIVEHAPHGRSYIHCCSAKEDTRLAAVEHLLVITEDILQRLMEREGIASSGWLPATPQSQHAAAYSHGSMPNLFKMETQSSKGSSPSVYKGERQAIEGPHEMARGPHQQTILGPSQQQAIPGMPQQSMTGLPQAVAPQPTRAERVQWIMGSEG